MKIDSTYTLKNGTKLMYEIFDNGFDIFLGESSQIAYMHQPEPFIPNPSISYEQNAIEMCRNMAESSRTQVETPFVMTEEMYNKQQSDIDYLMLLNDAL